MRARSRLGALALMGIAVLVLIGGCSDEGSGPSDRLLTVSPTSLQFSAWAGLNPNPAQQKVLVRFEGRIDTVWSAYATGTWLRLGPTGSDTIFVSVISNDLGAGTYHDTVFVTSPDAENVPVALPVTLEVNNRLVTSVDSVVFNSLSGGAPPDSQVFEVVDYVGTGVSFNAVTDASWIDLSGADGTAPDTVVVYVDQTGLVGGRYSDSIVITSDDLPGARTVLPVYLNLSSWSPQNLGSLSVDLEEVQMVSADIAWCSGLIGSSTFEPHGVLYRSEDGGASWNQKLDRHFTRFGGLAAISQTACWVVGDSALMLHTENGGEDWIDQDNLPISRNYNLRDVYFSSERYGWVVGRSGIIIGTADSGNTWAIQSSGVSHDLNDLWFIDDQTGWIAGNHGTLLATTDGGSTWTPLATGATIDIYGVSFVDINHGWAAASSGKILKTSNGGSSWQVYQTETNATLTDIQFANLMRGWAVGSDGVILFTDNGGLTWIKQQTGTEQALTGVHFIDSELGLVVGRAGTVLATASGGY